jgi:hypothetical protein
MFIRVTRSIPSAAETSSRRAASYSADSACERTKLAEGALLEGCDAWVAKRPRDRAMVRSGSSSAQRVRISFCRCADRADLSLAVVEELRLGAVG